MSSGNVVVLAPASAVPTAASPPATDVPALLARLRRHGLWALAVWGAAFALWATYAPISGAVVGSGLVKVEANRQTVSHRDGGTVARVLVREGQIVRRGQTLLVLEDMRIDSSVDLLQAQLAAELLRVSRLEAQAAQSPTWTPPADGTASDSGAAGASAPRAREALRRERAAFEARRRSLTSQLDAARSQIADAESEMTAHEREGVAAAEALRLVREELASNEALLKENFVNRTRVLGLQRVVAEYESRLQTSRAEFAKARQKRTELEGRIQLAKDSHVQAATEDLREATAKVVDLEERLRSSRDQAGRQVVVAPADGRLVDLKVNTPGSAIGPREAIVDIVPSDVPLVVEVRVAAEAISDVHAGQPVDVKLLAYKRRQIGLLEGRVINVSADALVDARNGAPYFAVQAEVAPDALARAELPTLLPGMAAEVYIKTSERSAVDFLLEPLTSALRRSFREH